MSIEKKPGKLAQALLLTPIRAYINTRSRIIIKRNDTEDMNGPYVILANHVNNWDPLFLNCYVKEPICFITGETLFRHPLLKRVLDFTGAIPKMKFKNDTRTIRSVLKAKKHDRVIGIFPEGNRNWDGRTEPLIYSTAKLVKLLDLPVVIATIRGGYLSHPRWANSHRKGLISISFVKTWDVGDFKNESPQSIHSKLTNALKYDEIGWQSEEQAQYNGKNLANYLERLLFSCPSCQRIGNLFSTNDIFRCKQCGYTVRYTPLGTFEPEQNKLYFSTVHDWNMWQLNLLEETLFDPAWSNDWNQNLRDSVKLFVSDNERPFQLESSGTISWNTTSPDLLCYQDNNGKQYHFPIQDIEGINIHLHHKLDFFLKNKLYRIVFYHPRTSAYKWLKTIQFLQATKSRKLKEI
ncbi:lysophospholipid acyltransferase family protein [Ornithinibacillus salinisoli]|uniref:Lysophospholipid acyltransferase family protein n=1 Tax=Ornithinibacillus salinisoli TaxID=1848459 RepID=A0ABW4VYB2_9BACI